MTDAEIEEWITERAAIMWVDGEFEWPDAMRIATAQFWSQYDED